MIYLLPTLYSDALDMMNKFSHPFIAELKRYVANQNATLGPVVTSLSTLLGIHHSSPKMGGAHEIRNRQRKLSEVTDMIHAAHVFHRCVRDNDCDSSPSTSSKRLHQDNIMSLLVGDYLLAQSSVDMADLRCPRAVGLIACGLEDYTRGEFLKLKLFDDRQTNALSLTDFCKGIEQYAELTCGSLLSNACLSAALLAGYPDKTASSQAGEPSALVHAFGFHTGSAHRLKEIFYCPDTNSEQDRVFMENLDVTPFVMSINGHIDKSIELLLRLGSSGSQQESLLATLEDMRC